MFGNAIQETPWDLRFNVGPWPVRVHPMFWLMGLIMSGGGGGGDYFLQMYFLGVLAFFISILVHELGHCWMMAYFGIRSSVVLYGGGGVAIPDSFGGRSRRALKPWQDILISFAGPLAGFLLLGFVVLIAIGLNYQVVIMWPLLTFGVSDGISLGKIFPIIIASPTETSQLQTPFVNTFINLLLMMNLFWGFMNLLPVYPLDGGQIARQLFVMRDPWDGVRKSLILSCIVGAAVTLMSLSDRSLWMTFLFGFLTYSCWIELQTMGSGGGRFNSRPW